MSPKTHKKTTRKPPKRAKTKPPRPTHRRAPAKKAPAPRKAKASTSAPAFPHEELESLREELTEARAELARIASGENSARRNLEVKVSEVRSVEERLRAELEAMRVDLRTALADLEIARADQARAESRLNPLYAELAAARDSERVATHASTDTREKLRDLRTENETLRKHLFDANEQLRRIKEPQG